MKSVRLGSPLLIAAKTGCWLTILLTGYATEAAVLMLLFTSCFTNR